MTTNNFKPILFSTEMVQAILAGRKTQTRRVVKEPMTTDVLDYAAEKKLPLNGFNERNGKIKEGDILWVRETFAKPPITAFGVPYIHKAGFDRTICGWKPSIHMPKEAARIFLKVTNVRVERLQDISEEDAIAEGIAIDKQPMKNNDGWYYPKNYLPENTEYWGSKYFKIGEYSKSFKSLWQSINAKKHPWESNPWVWVYEFQRIEKPENFLS